MENLRKKQYFFKISAILLVFDLIILISLSIAFYYTSADRIKDSIETENTNTLKQLEYYYEYNRQIVAGICLNIFNNATTQQILYSQETDYIDIYLHMQELQNMNYSMYAAIDSVVIYNAVQDTFYSSSLKNPYDGSELRQFMEKNPEIPILQPVLRTVAYQDNRNTPVSELVFSYFIYENRISGTVPSYVMVNQGAGWLMDMLHNYQKTKEDSSFIYYCNQAGTIYPLHNALPQENHQQVLDTFWISSDVERDTLFCLKQIDLDGKIYLLSGVQVGVDEDWIILLQDYDIIFGALKQLRDSLICVAIVSGVVSVLLLLFVSARLYKPVGKLVFSLQEDIRDQSLTEREDEFEWIAKQFVKIENKNKKLSSENQNFLSMTFQYLLMRYVTYHDTKSIQAFYQNFPSHWLVVGKPKSMQLYIVQLNNFGDNIYFGPADNGTLLYAIENLLCDLLPNHPMCSFFTYSDTELCVILGCNRDDEASALDACFVECKKIVREHLSITLTIASSCSQSTQHDLNKMWLQAREFLSYRYLRGSQDILNAKLCIETHRNFHSHYPISLDEELCTSLKNMDASAVEVVLIKIYHVLQTYHYRAANICVMSMLVQINQVLNALIEKGQLPDTTDTSSLYAIALKTDFLGDLFSSVQQYLKNLLMGQKELESVTQAPSLSDAVAAFVQEHYEDNQLSLSMISDNLHQASRSISKEFKQDKNMTINEYITVTRMSVAAHLLRHTDLSINEIVSKIGMDNTNYFYKLFKKTYHCTPREFAERAVGEA